MEPRQAELKTTQQRDAEMKRRFQIVKLEERIAPREGNFHGHCGHGACNGGYGGH